jgi:hypothetical protein
MPWPLNFITILSRVYLISIEEGKNYPFFAYLKSESRVCKT